MRETCWEFVVAATADYGGDGSSVYRIPTAMTERKRLLLYLIGKSLAKSEKNVKFLGMCLQQ